jgi:hypothetical protein
MQKRILFMAFCACVAFSATAQSAWQFGLKGGVGASTFYMAVKDSAFSAPWKIGDYHFGGYVLRHFGEKFTLRGELNYATRGCSITDYRTRFYYQYIKPSEGGLRTYQTGQDQLELKMISFCLLADYRIAPSVDAQLGIETGPYMLASFKGGGVAETNANLHDPSRSTYVPFLDAGLTYHFTPHFNAGVRYSFGIASYSLTDFSRSFQVSAGYTF